MLTTRPVLADGTTIKTKYYVRQNKKIPKLKMGAWFVPVRGSYLPMTTQGWLLHLLLLIGTVIIIIGAYSDKRDAATVIVAMILELIGLGTVFTYIASKKA